MNWDGFAAVADHLWQSTLLAGLALFLTALLRKKRARVRYWIWVTASLKFLLPFSLLVALGQQFAWSPAPASPLPRITVVDPVVLLPVVPINTDVITTPGYLITPVTSASHWLPGLIALWFAGVVSLTCYRLIIARRLRVLRRRSTLLSEGREVDSLRRVQSGLQVRGSIGLALSPSTIEPGFSAF